MARNKSEAQMLGWIDAMHCVDADGPHQDQFAAFHLCLEGERQFGFEKFTQARQLTRHERTEKTDRARPDA